jgi:hypothetical protein
MSTATDSGKLTRKRVRVILSPDKMHAKIVLAKPESKEPPYSREEITEALAANKVTFGIDEEAVSGALESGVFDDPITVATGKAFKKGDDTKFEYLFDTDPAHGPAEGSDGRIDYRQVSLIQNVKKDDVLARRTPPTDGEDGMGVNGEVLKAPRGRDLEFKNGDNTVVSEDGLELRAKVDGTVVMAHGKISVKDVMSIDSDIDFNVGNIDTVGSIRVSGSVKTGFTLKAQGNIEVAGNVEDATIEAAGNVLIKGGFFGGGDGLIKATGDVVVKYAEGQRIVSGGRITVGGELLNCRVQARDKVVIKGKKGKIVGGQVSAGKEVRSAVIGSEAATPTKVKIQLDEEAMRQYQEVLQEADRLGKDSERVKQQLYKLYKVQMDGKLPPDAKQALAQLEEFQKNVPNALEALKKKKLELEKKFEKFRDACVTVDERIFPGVQVYFGIVYREMSEEKDRCKLVLDGNQVFMTRHGGGDSED